MGAGRKAREGYLLLLLDAVTHLEINLPGLVGSDVHLFTCIPTASAFQGEV